MSEPVVREYGHKSVASGDSHRADDNHSRAERFKSRSDEVEDFSKRPGMSTTPFNAKSSQR